MSQPPEHPGNPADPQGGNQGAGSYPPPGYGSASPATRLRPTPGDLPASRLQRTPAAPRLWPTAGPAASRLPDASAIVGF